MFPSVAELTGGKQHLIFPIEKLDLADKEAARLYMNQYTEDVCNDLSLWFRFWPFGRLNHLYNVNLQFTFNFLIGLICELRSILL